MTEAPHLTERETAARPLRCVIVDDDPDFVAIVERYIGTVGARYNLIGFHNAVEALAYIRQNPVDLLVADYRMPVIDGATFVWMARKYAPGIRTILLTAYPVEAAHTADVNLVVSKDAFLDEIQILSHF